MKKAMDIGMVETRGKNVCSLSICHLCCFVFTLCKVNNKNNNDFAQHDTTSHFRIAKVVRFECTGYVHTNASVHFVQ